MGEMVVGELKGSFPVTIVPPSIVTSTYKEPFPGWIESIRTVDTFIVNGGKGRVKCVLGDPEATIYDVVPCDVVVNIILVALVAQENKITKTLIYHATSSKYNPLKFRDLYDYINLYFRQNPYVDPKGKQVKIKKAKILTSMESFHKYMKINFISPMKVLGLANIILCSSLDDKYSRMEKHINFNIRIVELYKPYLFWQAKYDDGNTESLRIILKERKIYSQVFSFDTRDIQWEEYFKNIHIPGVVKYLF